MPKLEGIEEKYWGKYKIDKENDTTVYSDEEHVYIDKSDNSKFTSVTTLIGYYSQEFDEEFWSAYKALESLMDVNTFSVLKRTLLAKKKFDQRILKKFQIDEQEFLDKQEEIKAEYARKRDESCVRGTAIHANFENSFYNRDDFDFKKYGYQEVKGHFDCKKNYYKLDLDRGVYPEFLISYVFEDGLKIAGQIDLLIKDGNDIYIIDWKGLDINTPILTDSGWKTMGTLTLNDKVFDKNGNLCNILHISDIHKNPCYKITFDNGDAFIADEDHRWLISLNKGAEIVEKVMTTEEISEHLKNRQRRTDNMPRIYNSKSLNLSKRNLPIDPYVLGAWLGNGNKDCGIIANGGRSFWEEIKNRGYKINEDLTADKVQEHTICGLREELDKLNLLNNKHIPEEYLLSSYEQRLDLLRGLMDSGGYYNPKRKHFIMTSSRDWQIYEFVSLISSFGWKPAVSNIRKHCNGKVPKAKNICFTTEGVNPFLIKNQNIKCPTKDGSNFRNIVSVEAIPIVETKCIEVDSPTHTYLAGKNLIVTHNTNKEIKKESYYNRASKSHQMMKYPMNNLMDTNFWHYTLQLSLYAYLLQQINPDFNIKGLKLVHVDHEGKQHEYDVEYKKNDVQKMLKHYKKSLRIKEDLDKNKPVIL